MQSGPVQFIRSHQKRVRTESAKPDLPALDREDGEDPANSESALASSSDTDESNSHLDLERPRKRRRREADDIEASYFQRLAEEEEREERRRQPLVAETQERSQDEILDDGSDRAADAEDHHSVPVHEALTSTNHTNEKTKLQRTVFLSNVSTSAIKSKSARRQLLKHLESALQPEDDDLNKDKIESMRFRSTAYASGSGPKRAAFATKELMDETTQSTNAYAVFSSQEAAKKVAKKLNGSIVLDRHLRIDHLAKPSSIDHKRCVFVGNLNFVDEEPTEGQIENAESKPRRPRAKQPADAEEGLWRTFSKVGKVENVRVVRDKHTRVGKGFAYVQFADQNSVEAALLLNEKKFPPMLPRMLRVMRAKKSREGPSIPLDKRPLPGSRSASNLGNHARRPLNSVRKATRMDGDRIPTKLVFEGHRASNRSVKDRIQVNKRSPKTTSRSAKRGAAFKATGGRQKRDNKP